MNKYFTITIIINKSTALNSAGYFENAEAAGSYGANLAEMAGYKWDDITAIKVTQRQW